MKRKIQTAIQLVFPARCISCGELVESDFGLCGPCWRDTPMIGGLVCNLCGIPLPGPDDGDPSECDACMAAQRSWNMGRSALLYQGNARRIVLGLKHGDRQDLARPASKWMALAAKPLVRPEMLVVPVPLHRWRLLRRRYNQAGLLARALANELGLSFCPDPLIRPRERGSMDGLSRDQRFEKMENAIKPHPNNGRLMAKRPVLIVDDVMTSGATLEAATRACLQAGASEVNVQTLARVAKDA